MYVMSSKPTFFFKVTIKRPNEKTGEWEAFSFLAEFKRRTRPEVEAMLEKGIPRDAEICANEFVGWRASDIKTPDGADLAVTDENKAALLAEPHAQTAIVLAWLEAVVKGPAKN